MKRTHLLAASLLVLAATMAGCAAPSASHYSVTPGVRVIERAPRKISHVPAVVSGSAGAVQ